MTKLVIRTVFISDLLYLINRLANIFKDKLILIAGGGHFGTEAMISVRASSARVILVDNMHDCKASRFIDERIKVSNIDEALRIRSDRVIFFLCDAVEFLMNFMKKATPDYIVPAIPGHLAGEVVKRWLEGEGFRVEGESEMVREVLKEIPESLVMNFNEDKGIIVTSYMPKGKLCKISCDQPLNFCRTTGRPKAGPMYSIFEFATWGKADVFKILRSYKLQRDVGCFRGEEFASFLSDLKKIETPYSLAIGTSCSCHGVLNLFSVD
ncbi:MAG: hypothetical protein L6N94_03920 [Candidatus Methylarchaceae archaeon HK01M]|nr:hypothetical protein [Candidatus Methylarchaceae archaeon HK01M]